MATVASTSTVSYIYKSAYSGKKPENLASRDRVFFSKVKKVPGFTGNNHIYALTRRNNIGTTVTFADMQTLAGTTAGDQFTVTHKTRYGGNVIDRISILKAGDDKGAFTRLVTREMDSTLDDLGHRLAVDLYGDGSGAIAQVVTGTSSPITVAPELAKNIQVGMIIRANPTKTGTVGNFRSGGGTVTGVVESTGTITYTGTITSLAVADYLYPAVSATDTSEYDAVMAGLGAWITTSSSPAALFGVTRTTEVEKLSGWKVTTTSNSIEENIITLGAYLRRAGSHAKDIFISPMNWATLSKNLESKVMRDDGGDAKFGFSSIKMATPMGLTNIWADPECPPDVGYFLDMETFELLYLGPGFPHLIQQGGGDAGGHQVYNLDAIEYRFSAIGNLKCTAPGRSGVFQIA